MKLSLETVGRLYASGRNYVNYFLGVATTLGLVSASQNKSVTDSINEIVNGVSMIYHGATSLWNVLAVLLAPIITIITARWASNSAKTVNQVAAVTAVANDKTDPVAADAAKAALITSALSPTDVKVEGQIVTSPQVAAAVPSMQVVSK